MNDPIRIAQHSQRATRARSPQVERNIRTRTPTALAYLSSRNANTGSDRQHTAYPESPNTRSACWSVRRSAHRERCGAGPSEFPEACRKGPMHAPVSTPRTFIHDSRVRPRAHNENDPGPAGARRPRCPTARPYRNQTWCAVTRGARDAERDQSLAACTPGNCSP